MSFLSIIFNPFEAKILLKENLQEPAGPAFEVPTKFPFISEFKPIFILILTQFSYHLIFVGNYFASIFLRLVSRRTRCVRLECVNYSRNLIECLNMDNMYCHDFLMYL